MTGKYGSKYQSYIDPKTTPSVLALQETDEPVIIRSDDIAKDKEKYLAQDYVVVGESKFKSYEESRSLKITFTKLDRSESAAYRQAAKVAATHVLLYRKKIKENWSTNYNSSNKSYSSEREDVFENHSVFMVKKK